jgi:hypothetical protein
VEPFDAKWRFNDYGLYRDIESWGIELFVKLDW